MRDCLIVGIISPDLQQQPLAETDRNFSTFVAFVKNIENVHPATWVTPIDTALKSDPKHREPVETIT